jgi:hypothetical protein
VVAGFWTFTHAWRSPEGQLGKISVLARPILNQDIAALGTPGGDCGPL